MTAKHRHRLHLLSFGQRCSLQPPSEHTNPPANECLMLGCCDVVHDVLVELFERVSSPRFDHAKKCVNWDAYVYATARAVLSDRARTGRVRIGLPAKPSRVDGKIGDVLLRLGQEDPQLSAWRIRLFRMMREYVCRLDRSATTWPTETWAAERAQALGGEYEWHARELQRDIVLILQIAELVMGKQWVLSNLIWPLQVVAMPGSIDQCDDWCSPAFTPEESFLNSELLSHYRAQRQIGTSRREALRFAVQRVHGIEPPAWSEELRSILEEIDLDLQLAT